MRKICYDKVGGGGVKKSPKTALRILRMTPMEITLEIEFA